MNLKNLPTMKIRYCLLVKTIPEYSKRDGTLYTCSIGLSPELGLIRIYPLPPTGMKKWGIYELDVERNKRDSRKESWKLSSYSRKENWTSFTDDVMFLRMANKSKVLSYLANYISPSISELNKERKSIGLIKADHIYGYWDVNKKFVNTSQVGMFEDVELAWFASYTKTTKQKESRVKFIDADGKHDLQLNEWGLYEYQRKFGAKEDAFRFINKGNSNYLMVGNMHNYRSTWIGMTTFNLNVEESSLFNPLIIKNR
jgi:hypothetical protein